MTIERQKLISSNRPVAATSRSESHSAAFRSAQSNGKAFGISEVLSGNQAMQQILNARLAQAKLSVSQPGDKYEQEADRVAERVMRMPEPDGQKAEKVSGDLLNGRIQRACQECEEEQVQRQAIGDEEIEADEAVDEGLEKDESEPDETGMPKRESGIASATRSAPINVPRGGGHSLESGLRHRMERRIGYDFSHVRVHTDEPAVQSARKLKAHAYTVGKNIYFNAGRYSPVGFEGQKLLAHELTHVVQQTAGGGDLRISRRKRRKVNTPPPKSKGRRRSSSASSCPQGKQSKVVHNDCGNSSPVKQSDFIRHLAVSIKSQTVTASWGPPASGTPATRTEQFDCSPNPKVTPKGTDLVGTKCSVNHTNMKKDGMAWFTGFQSTGLRIGFHNSQRVGTGIFSHGCVRVLCPIAEKINKNTWSGVTTIKVT